MCIMCASSIRGMAALLLFGPMVTPCSISPSATWLPPLSASPAAAACPALRCGVPL
jgi:hypothetical protein